MSRLGAIETSLHAGWNVVQRMELIPATAVSSASHLENRAAIRMEAWEMCDRDRLAEASCLGLGQGGSHVARESPLRPPLRGRSPQAATTSKRRRVETSEERRMESSQTMGPGATSAQEPWFARLRRKQKEKRRRRAATLIQAVAQSAAQPLMTAASVAPPPPPAPPSGKGKLSRQEKRGGHAAKGKGKQKR
jgi:hypothetical protein